MKLNKLNPISALHDPKRVTTGAQILALHPCQCKRGGLMLLALAIGIGESLIDQMKNGKKGCCREIFNGTIREKKKSNSTDLFIHTVKNKYNWRK
jgi:hypothetical protein